MIEEWRQWDDWYDVSSLGNVRSWSVPGSQVTIAKRYGVSRSLVGRVVRKEAWT